MKKKLVALLVIIVTLAFAYDVLSVHSIQIPITGSSFLQFVFPLPLLDIIGVTGCDPAQPAGARTG